MLNIIILGAPGSGKGTQAVRVCEFFKLNHFSTGDLLRDAIAQATPLGEQAKAYIDKGELVPDSLVTSLLFENVQKVASQSTGILFDGFPRNTQQCKDLDAFMNELNHPVNAALSLEVPQDELIKRMLLRGRKDDTEEVIRNRFKVFDRETQPVIQYYKNKNALYAIDGLGTMEEITNHLVEKIKLIQNETAGAG